MDAHTAMLIVAASEQDANLYHATRFLAPDAFVFIETATHKILLMSDLEIDRARQQSTVDLVLSFSAYQQKLKHQGTTEPLPSSSSFERSGFEPSMEETDGVDGWKASSATKCLTLLDEVCSM